MSRFRNFSRQAAADLDHIVGWVLDHGNAGSAAERLLTAVLAVGERLAERLLPDPYRSWSIPRHRLLLVYDPTTTPPTILRVLNTARDLPPLLADLRNQSGEAPG